MLTKIVTAMPPYSVTREKAADELKKRMTGSQAAERMIDMAAAYSGIDQRYIIVPDAEEVSGDKFYSDETGFVRPDTKKTMTEYEKWSRILSKKAVSELLKESGINPSEVERLITISCTGFFAPGLDYHIIKECNLPVTVKRTNIGFMGCAAALIGVNSVFEAMRSSSSGMTTVMLAIELCSIHIQMEATRDNILANMIFADGCAAALFTKNAPDENAYPEIRYTGSILFNDSSEFMGWNIGNNGFEMILSSRLPGIILDTASPELLKMLNDAGYKKEDIKYWALHPGGRAILDSLQKGLQLSDDEMHPSREVLRKYGNMSSASILYVMKEILDNNSLRKNELICAAAFGPGLTMEVAVFEIV